MIEIGSLDNKYVKPFIKRKPKTFCLRPMEDRSMWYREHRGVGCPCHMLPVNTKAEWRGKW